MRVISKFNKGFRFLLCVIDIYSKYAWVIPLKDKKVITITNAFQKILNESARKPNNLWVDQGSALSTRSLKTWLEKNEKKSDKYITSISQNVYIDKLNNIVNKYNNTYHSIIIMKTVDVKLSTYIDPGKRINEKDPKFKIAYIVRIPKYKNIFVKGYVPN